MVKRKQDLPIISTKPDKPTSDWRFLASLTCRGPPSPLQFRVSCEAAELEGWLLGAPRSAPIRRKKSPAQVQPVRRVTTRKLQPRSKGSPAQLQPVFRGKAGVPCRGKAGVPCLMCTGRWALGLNPVLHVPEDCLTCCFQDLQPPCKRYAVAFSPLALDPANCR